MNVVRWVILSFLFLFVNGVYKAASAQVTFGVKAGGNYSYGLNRVNFNGVYYFNFIMEPLYRPVVGLFGEYHFADHFSGRIDIVYMGGGYLGYNGAQESPYYFNYLTIPLSIKYRATHFASLRAGVFGSYMLNDGGVLHKDTDGGFLVGLDFAIGKNWGVGLESYWGFLNISTTPEWNEQYSRMLQINTWYRISIVKSK